MIVDLEIAKLLSNRFQTQTMILE